MGVNSILVLAFLGLCIGRSTIVLGSSNPDQQEELFAIEEEPNFINDEDSSSPDDVTTILISLIPLPIIPAASEAKRSKNVNDVPEVEFHKLKGAALGAGLSDAKADRVVRAAKTLNLKLNEVVDLKKVMLHPSTTVQYADRVRRALEEAVVDHKPTKMQDASQTTLDNAAADTNSQTAKTPNSQMNSPTNLPGKDNAQPNQVNIAPGPQPVFSGYPNPITLQQAGMAAPLPNGPQIFFGTPLTSQALPEDLENLWVLSSHLLGRRDAFELVQFCYRLKLPRAEVFDLQNEFATGSMTRLKATQLMARLKSRLDAQVPIAKLPISGQIDPAVVNRLKTVVELSGANKSAVVRLVRAVLDSRLNTAKVQEISDVIQSKAASHESISKFTDHLEDVNVKELMSAENERADEDILSVTPEEAKGADWIFMSPTDDDRSSPVQRGLQSSNAYWGDEGDVGTNIPHNHPAYSYTNYKKIQKGIDSDRGRGDSSGSRHGYY